MRPLMTRDVCNDIYGTKVVHQKSTTQYQMIIKNGIYCTVFAFETHFYLRFTLGFIVCAVFKH